MRHLLCSLRPIRLLFVLLCWAGAAGSAQAQDAAAPQITPRQAQQLLGVLQDPQRRAQFTATLEALTRALPIAVPQAAPAPAEPAATPAVAPLPLKPDSLGLQMLGQVSGWTQAFSEQVAGTSRALGDLPLLWLWLQHVADNPETRADLLDAGWKLVLVLGCAGLAGWLARRGVRPLMRAIEAYATRVAPAEPAEGAGEDARHRLGLAWRLLRKLPTMLARLLLDLLPTGAVLLAGNLLLGTGIGHPAATRLVILHALDAYAILRLIMALTRLLVLPSCPPLRLLRVDDVGAAYAEAWVRRITAVVVFGNALGQSALLFGLYPSAQDELFKLVMLVAHVMLVIVVLQCRHTVARRIRLRQTREGERDGVLALLLGRLAAVWHWIAIFYIVALWVVWVVEVRNGPSRLTHLVLVTVAVMIVARLVAIVVLGGLYRGLHVSPEVAAQYPGLERRAGRYFPFVRTAVSGLIFLIAAVALMQAWGLDAFTWFRRGLGNRLLSAAGTVAVTVLLAIVAWEAANASLDRRVARLDRDGNIGRAARLRTLMPILQTSLLVAILVVIGLTVLSEIGVNIAPLLAGAGILGVALGFGSQKLVQDLITGLFLLLENAMQVGDNVTVSGLSGTVEHLSIRTIRLRAGDGSVHIIPFSSVTSVTNTNRGIGNAAVSVTVAYEEDTDRVGEALKAIAEELRADPDYAEKISSDLQLWGVDKVDGATATLVGQIVCTDSGRWGVQREFNRRVQKRFQDLGIALALPTQAMVVRQARAAAPPGPAIEPGPSAATRTESPAPAALGHES